MKSKEPFKNWNSSGKISNKFSNGFLKRKVVKNQGVTKLHPLEQILSSRFGCLGNKYGYAHLRKPFLPRVSFSFVWCSPWTLYNLITLLQVVCFTLSSIPMDVFPHMSNLTLIPILSCLPARLGVRYIIIIGICELLIGPEAKFQLTRHPSSYAWKDLKNPGTNFPWV